MLAFSVREAIRDAVASYGQARRSRDPGIPGHGGSDLIRRSSPGFEPVAFRQQLGCDTEGDFVGMVAPEIEADRAVKLSGPLGWQPVRHQVLPQNL